MLKNWWKFLGVLLLAYAVYAGFMSEVPRMAILNETIRNLYFHVPMWFTMFTLFAISLYHSFKFLATNNIQYDSKAKEAINTGIVFGILGIITGSLWAKYTWGTWWTGDVKLNGSAITMLMYAAYIILRNSMDDEYKTGRIAAVYNIFAFVFMIVFIGILPRMTDSLHPGNGGNPAFGNYDLDDNMKLVFYPAVIGWILIGLWIYQIKNKIAFIKTHQRNEISN